MGTPHLSCCHMSWLPNTKSTYRADRCFKLCLVTAGHALWEIAGEKYEIQKDDVILLDDSTLRRFVKIFGPESLSMQIIMFSPETLKNTNFIYLFLNTPLQKTRIVHGAQAEGLISMLTRISDEFQTKSPYYQELAHGLFNTSVALIARHTSFEYTKPTKNYKKIRRALQYIDRNYTSPLTLGQLSASVEMTPSSFSKAFLKCMGIGVTQYILRRRIDYAIELLEKTNKNVLEIALECGFNNGAAFYQSFKKITGSMPKRYRKQ